MSKSRLEEQFLWGWEHLLNLERGDNMLPYPIREYVFASPRRWRFDFAFPRIKLAIEVEGRGRHQSFGGFEKDAEKYNAAVKLGWRVLRYTPAMVMRGDAINDVLEILR